MLINKPYTGILGISQLLYYQGLCLTWTAFKRIIVIVTVCIPGGT